MSQQFNIADRIVGTGNPCFIIAEVAQAHDGSLGAAHAYIDAVAKTGADAIKFQTHIAIAESTSAEPFRVKFSKQDATRYDYWKRMEFTAEQWAGLTDHARDCKLIFLSSAFSIQAVELLEKLGMPAWKVGSGEIGSLPMLERMATTKKPVLLSNGLADWNTLDRAVELIKQAGTPLGLFQCTTAYPCPPEKIGLNVMDELRRRYDCPVGLSDHSGKIYAGVAAATLGANLFEAHIVFSRECFGPDTPASMTTDEFQQLVEGIRFVEKALETTIDKDASASELAELRKIFGKSVVAARDLPAGHKITNQDLEIKKPGTGIPAADLKKVIGHVLVHGVTRDTLLSESDFQK